MTKRIDDQASLRDVCFGFAEASVRTIGVGSLFLSLAAVPVPLPLSPPGTECGTESQVHYENPWRMRQVE